MITSLLSTMVAMVMAGGLSNVDAAVEQNFIKIILKTGQEGGGNPIEVPFETIIPLAVSNARWVLGHGAIQDVAAF